MQRFGYDYSPLPVQDGTPWYAVDTTKTTQAIYDYQYVQALNHYYDMAEQWLQTQTMMRANGTDPKNYVPVPFKVPIPQRQRIFYDAANVEHTTTLPVDARIVAPILPDYVEPTGNAGFKAAPNTQDQMMATLMMKLVSIENLLKQLLQPK
jgi:hypothetical protein